MKRRCALTPGQLLLSYAALMAFSTAIALPFGWHGLWLIPLWSLFEISVAGALFMDYMLHAADGEQISFSPEGQLAIEVVRSLDARHYRMNPAWAHLERGGPACGCAAARCGSRSPRNSAPVKSAGWNAI